MTEPAAGTKSSSANESRPKIMAHQRGGRQTPSLRFTSPKYSFDLGVFLKMFFFKMDFFKSSLFLKMFFPKFIFQLKFFGAQTSKIVPRPEFCPARKHEKRGVLYFGNLFFLSWVCSALLAQLIYRFFGAIYRTGTAQRHEFDDHRGNDFDDHRSLKKFCTGTALF